MAVDIRQLAHAARLLAWGYLERAAAGQDAADAMTRGGVTFALREGPMDELDLSPAQQATMTPEELLAWAHRLHAARNRWPTARWRVEETIGGNSRLLTQRAAQRLSLQTGGMLREVIPSRSALLRHVAGSGDVR